MKKKILGITMMAAIALAAGWNFSQNENNVLLSDLALSNVEALASEINPDCPNGCISGGGGCYCYHKYSDLQEYKW